jgi:hypothetical protein
MLKMLGNDEILMAAGSSLSRDKPYSWGRPLKNSSQCPRLQCAAVCVPAAFFAWLVVTLLAYGALTQFVKTWYIRRFHAWL